MPAPTNGELLERARYAEAELERVKGEAKGDAGAARIAELEGLLAGQTRQLEQCQREAADADVIVARLEAELAERPTFELAEASAPAELVELARATEAIATRITAELETLTPSEVLELADAAARLAGAHQALTPRPLPALR